MASNAIQKCEQALNETRQGKPNPDNVLAITKSSENLVKDYNRLNNLITFLYDLSKGSDKNSIFYLTRTEIARQYKAWRELFSCETEYETTKILSQIRSEELN